VKTIETKESAKLVGKGVTPCPVLRFAPSPTGDLHIGSLGMALVNFMLAKSMGGKVFLRIEDTDQKREVAGSADKLIAQLKEIGIEFDGKPVYQSKRGDIYKKYADELVAKGLAYVDDGAVRLRLAGTDIPPIKWHDLVKGDMVIPAVCDRDPVIVKSTGIPPYNFAHIVDDTLMGTTHVVRGEEWIPSTAEHFQIHMALFGGTPPWSYAHMPVISILDNGNKRKLSKRKDKEALVEHFLSVGYPIDAIIEYLLTLYNTDYEIWRTANPNAKWIDFNFRFEKIGSNSPLFDWEKLDSISSTLISKMKIEPLMREIKKFFGDKLTATQYDHVKTLLNVDRDTDRPRKDITKYADVTTEFDYVFRPVKISPLLKKYAELLHASRDKDDWFTQCKTRATEFGFKNVREFTQAIRVELTGRERSTDLYAISRILL